MKKIILFTVVLFLSMTAFSNQISTPIMKNLTMNGCTAFVNGNWKHCCDQHDLVYWFGGSFETRKAADEQLYQCVDAVGGPSEIIYQGVRLAGSEFWGSAWGKNKMQNLTDEEIELVEAENALWEGVGRPWDFDFINYETALFRQLDASDIEKLKAGFEKFMQTNAYKNFEQDYVSKTGNDPGILEWIDGLE